jgi:pyruvate/2-oxoglutarate/acetoin dehydrogenase E1 component
VFLEHKRLYSIKGEAGEPDEVAPLGVAEVVRPGRDLTVVTAMKGVHDSLAAAEQLAGDGIDAEVIDLRTLRPLDRDTVLDSVRRTNRLLVVEEGPRTGGWAGGVLADVAEGALEYLDDVWRLTTDDAPIPYSPPLEDAFLPSAERIVASVRAHLNHTSNP